MWPLRDVCGLFGRNLVATSLLVDIVPLGFSSSATTSFVLNFAFFAIGFGDISSPPSSSSPPKLSNVFAARFFGFFFASPLPSTTEEAGFAVYSLLTISSNGLTNTSAPVTLVGYSGLSFPSTSASPILIRL